MRRVVGGAALALCLVCSLVASRPAALPLGSPGPRPDDAADRRVRLEPDGTVTLTT